MSNPEGTTEHVAEPEEKVTNEQKEERNDAGKEESSEGPQDPPPVVVINPILKDNGHAVVVDENERTDPPCNTHEERDEDQKPLADQKLPGSSEPKWVFLPKAEWNTQLIRPFTTSPWVAAAAPHQLQEHLGDDALSKRAWVGTGFSSEVLSEEFVRFRCRDLTLTFIGGVYVGAALGTPLFLFPTTSDWRYGNYVAAVLFAMTTTLDIICHVCLAHTTAVANLRQGLQFIVAVAALQNTNWVMAFLAYGDECHVLLDMFPWFGYHRPTPSAEEYLWYCQDSIKPFPFITNGVTFLLLTMPPLVVTGLMIFALTLFPLVRIAVNASVESPGEIAIKATVLFVASMMFLGFYWQRHFASMYQFQQAIIASREMNLAGRKEDEVDELLCQMIPAEALDRLSCGVAVSDYTEEASVLFSDMVQFTAWSSKRSAHQVVEMLNIVCQQFDLASVRYSVEKVKTIGDAYWAVTGLPAPVEGHAEKMIDFGNHMHTLVEASNKKHKEWEGVRLRIGINSGPLSGGILGTQSISYEVFGHTSHIAEECEKGGVPNRVTVSQATLEFANLQPHSAANTKVIEVDGETMTLYVMRRETVEKMRAVPGPTETSANVMASGDLMSPLSQRSRHSGYSLASSMQSTTPHEAKKKRQEFLAKRAAARRNGGRRKKNDGDDSDDDNGERGDSALDTGATTTTIEELQLRYSQRKYNWFLFRFQDDHIEELFETFAREVSAPLRKNARIATFVTSVFLLIMVGVQATAFSAASIACFAFSILCATLDLALYILPRFVCVLPTSDRSQKKVMQASNGLQHLSLVLSIVALGMMGGGQSITSNTLLYVYGWFSSLEVVGNAGTVPTLLYLVIHFWLMMLPVLAFEWRTMFWTTTFIFSGFSLTCVICLVLVVEKKYRRQFLERKVAAHFVEEQGRRVKEQEALLASIVPDHVVNDLTRWMAARMPLDKSIVRRIPQLVVCFVRLAPDGGLATALPNSEPGDRTAATPSPDILVASIGSGGSDLPKGESPCNQPGGDGDAVGDDRRDGGGGDVGGGDSGLSWMAPMHAAVDTIIMQLPAIDKVKTIGDLLMLAGPFTGGHSCAQAADQTIAALAQMSKVGAISAGIHMGEIVGAVLGTNRLCFDIFGDTVNTASRALSTGQPHDLSLSEDVYDAFQLLHGKATQSGAHEDEMKEHEQSASDTTADKFEKEVEQTLVPGVPEAAKDLRATSPTSMQSSRCRGATFSEPQERIAKGKGSIFLRVVDQLPTVVTRKSQEDEKSS